MKLTSLNMHFLQATLYNQRSALDDDVCCDPFFCVIGGVESQADFLLNWRLEDGGIETLAPVVDPTNFGCERLLLVLIQRDNTCCFRLFGS
jgi:hypothetical protein